MVTTFLLANFAFADVSADKLLEKVSKTYSKIRSFRAKITQKNAVTGEVVFYGKIYFKKPKLKITFTGPKDFEGTGFSAVREGGKTVLVDKDGFAVTTSPNLRQNFYDIITGDILDLGKARVFVVPEETGKKKPRFYTLQIRMPKEEETKELDPYASQQMFMEKLKAGGRISEEDLEMFKKYSHQARRSAAQSPSSFWQRDCDVKIDRARGLITEIDVIDDGDVVQKTKFRYTFSGGCYIPSSVVFEEGGDKIKTVLSQISVNIPIKEKIFKYREKVEY